MNTSPGIIMGLNAKPLCSAPRRLAAGIAVLALGWPVLASADCVDMRKPTAGEMEFHSRAIATLVAALPPVPVSGKLQNKDSVTTLGQQCNGTTGDFSLEATRSYELNYRKAIVSVAINVTRLPAAPAPNVPTTQTATQPPVAPPNPSAPAAPGQPPASEPVKDAVDTVNKLRGLFGR